MSIQRKFLVAGNWKMNGTLASNKVLIETLNEANIDYNRVDVVVVPPALYVDFAHRLVRREIAVGAQNLHPAASGAFTGEISPSMLKDVGAKWVILGHSERRQHFGESNEVVGKKVAFALQNNLSVLACVGESLEQRKANDTIKVVKTQLQEIIGAIVTLAGKSDAQEAFETLSSELVIAYEPVWAIGTGLVATPEQAQQVHEEIRAWLREKISSKVADSMRILYGGSVAGSNCKLLAMQQDIDGFLVGGASLKPEFVAICNAI